MNKIFQKIALSWLILLFLIANVATAQPGAGVYQNESTSFISSDASNSFRSNVSVSAVQNLTFSLSNRSTIELPSEASPVIPNRLTIDVLTGFEPEQRLNSEFKAAVDRKSNVENYSLSSVNDRLLLNFNASNPSNASYVTYDLSFNTPLIVSGTDFVSLGFSADKGYNSSKALIGISLKIRDLQGKRYYVSIEVSNQFIDDSIGLSEWFLGEALTVEEPFPKYPVYFMRHGSTSDPWLRQLSLSQPLSSLNLSKAWLDGLLIGGEIGFIGAPPYIYSMTQLEALFYFVLVHSQPFTINQQIVNSTRMIFPFQNSLNFSGVAGKSVSVLMAGDLRPLVDKEEPLNNATLSIREVFFNLSGLAQMGVAIEKELNITVFSKSVKNCLLTLDNSTAVDLTDELLSGDTLSYGLPSVAGTLEVLLTFYKYNAWIFSLRYLDVTNIKKIGIVGEQFSTNEGLVDVNSTIEESTYLAVRTAGLTPSAITINGIETSLKSMLTIDDEAFFIIPLSKPEELGEVALYSIRYMLSDRPLYESSTETPFELHLSGSIFRIFTPFNVEAEQGFYLPITVQMLTFKTFDLRLECDSSFFEVQQKEVIAYSDRIHYEYFALKPLQTGHSIVSLKIIDPISERPLFSVLFSVKVTGSLVAQAPLYVTLGVTLLSIAIVFQGENLSKRILHR